MKHNSNNATIDSTAICKSFITHNPFLLSCLLSASKIKKIMMPIDNNNKNII